MGSRGGEGEEDQGLEEVIEGKPREEDFQTTAREQVEGSEDGPGSEDVGECACVCVWRGLGWWWWVNVHGGGGGVLLFFIFIIVEEA